MIIKLTADQRQLLSNFPEDEWITMKQARDIPWFTPSRLESLVNKKLVEEHVSKEFRYRKRTINEIMTGTK